MRILIPMLSQCIEPSAKSKCFVIKYALVVFAAYYVCVCVGVHAWLLACVLCVIVRSGFFICEYFREQRER